MYHLIIRATAITMANEAYEWYEQQQEGLGEQFLRALKESFEKLEQNPLLFSITYNHFRKVAIPKFPFIVVYKIRNNDVVISAIFHTSRKPKKKYRKL